ncbi:hypothetical protein BKA70DRAFT_1384345 [Coprinopsis sp. MPI-PUGE-AT-0042]|nr:hypothetical protein BKA70DRAFT_1384345 [Coprinopsis sp. MPI-PUGE-AT-0042]
MSVDDATVKQQRKSWMQMIPRPGSSSGSAKPSSPGSRPSSSGGNSGVMRQLGSRSNQSSVVNLATTKEGEELALQSPKPSVASAEHAPSKSAFARPASIIRNLSFDSPPVSRPHTPKRRYSNHVELDNRASQIIMNALERTTSQQTTKSKDEGNKSSFGFSLSNMLSLSRSSTRDEDRGDRGRSMFSGTRWATGKQSQSQAPADKQDVSRSRSRARSSSPFGLRRFRTRESSPQPEPVPLTDAELSEVESSGHARSAFYGDDTDNDASSDDSEGSESLSDDEEVDWFDPETERNTEQNAIIAPLVQESSHPELEDYDPVGEGVNVVIAPEPYFPTSLNSLGTKNKRNPRRRKTLRHHEPLPFNTSRPAFQRDRCTITITQGDPDAKLAELGRKRRRYVVASDLSEESRYAVEWGIGTVLRDGDEMLLVNVSESDAKVDPSKPNAADRSTKLRNQQERQGMAYILARQVTALLQRTKLNVTVLCQAWHAKNARHMLLDIVDHTEPTMLIVGSRGLSHINGILLGSTSHYLIEKCAVPVMVARRRLKRPPKKAAHLSKSRTHIKLAEAGIDRVAGKVDADVHAMRDELEKEEHRTGTPDQDLDALDEDDAVEGDNEDDDAPRAGVDVIDRKH